MGRQLGVKQREFLIEYGDGFPGAVRFKPTRAGRPWPIMQSLARRGLVFIERRQVAYWCPGVSRWDKRNEMCWFVGLTMNGQIAADLESDKDV